MGVNMVLGVMPNDSSNLHLEGTSLRIELAIPRKHPQLSVVELLQLRTRKPRDPLPNCRPQPPGDLIKQVVDDAAVADNIGYSDVQRLKQEAGEIVSFQKVGGVENTSLLRSA